LKYAILGGSFDPIHRGHIEIARQAADALELDRVMLLPDGDPPHKRARAEKQHRYEMTRIAAAEDSRFFASPMEVERQGTTYTVDTLTELHTASPDDEIYYIVGADTVLNLEKWRSFPRVARLTRFLAVGRPGQTGSHAEADRLRREYGADIRYLTVTGPDVSSTEIRDLARAGADLSPHVPEGVAAYIRKNGLYLADLSFSDIESELSRRLKPSRFRHTQGVVETARRLAHLHGADEAKCALAALLHDCAKPLTGDALTEAARPVPDVDAEELASPPILHAPAGAVVAYREFGVRDGEILSAIRCHTIGKSRMTPVEQIVFLSDFIEPYRAEFPGLSRVRALAEQDLAAACVLAARLTGDYLASQNAKSHTRTIQWIKEEEHV